MITSAPIVVSVILLALPLKKGAWVQPLGRVAVVVIVVVAAFVVFDILDRIIEI